MNYVRAGVSKCIPKCSSSRHTPVDGVSSRHNLTLSRGVNLKDSFCRPSNVCKHVCQAVCARPPECELYAVFPQSWSALFGLREDEGQQGREEAQQGKEILDKRKMDAAVSGKSIAYIWIQFHYISHFIVQSNEVVMLRLDMVKQCFELILDVTVLLSAVLVGYDAISNNDKSSV